jgi:hypothetical protein
MARFGRLYGRSWDGIDVDGKLIIPREKLLRILRLLVDHVAPEPGTELTVGRVRDEIGGAVVRGRSFRRK